MKFNKNRLYINSLFILSYLGPGFFIGALNVRFLELYFLYTLITKIKSIIKIKTCRYVFYYFLLFSFLVIFSNLYGYVFLDIYPTYRDFMDILKFLIYVSCFYIGYTLNLKNYSIQDFLKIQTVILMILFIICVMQIQHSEWIKLFITKFYLQKSFYETAVDGFLIVRPGATFGNANSFTIVILPIFIFSYNAVFFKKPSFYPITNCFLCIILMILTNSKSGMLCLCIAMVCPFLYLSLKRKMIYFVKTSVLLSVAFLSLSIVNKDVISQMISHIKDGIYGFELLDNQTSLDIRKNFWRAGLYKYHFSPLFGWGVNKSPRTENNHGYVQIDRSKNQYVSVDTFSGPHNQYIDILMKFGIFGLIFYLFIFYLIFWPNVMLKGVADSLIKRFSMSVNTTFCLFLLVNVFFIGFIFSNVIAEVIFLYVGLLHNIARNIVSKNDYLLSNSKGRVLI